MFSFPITLFQAFIVFLKGDLKCYFCGQNKLLMFSTFQLVKNSLPRTGMLTVNFYIKVLKNIYFSNITFSQ